MKSRLDSINDWNSRARRAKYRVSLLAKHCRINERHLRRYFVSKFGFSPHALMSIRKFESARSLPTKVA
jgi:AraC-like DNA-binding protein